MVEDGSNNSRKVKFHSRVQFKTIRHVANFSDDEIRDGWYNKKDFIRMSDEVGEIAKLVANGQTVYEGEELCTRGLEHLVEEDVADYRAEKMIESIDAVLDEQDEQIDENIYDPYTIAEVYGDIVTPLLREAYLVGLRDAKEGAAAAAAIPDIHDDYTTTRNGNRSAAAASASSSLSQKKTPAKKDSSKWVSGSDNSGDNSVKAPRRRKSNNSSIADLAGQLEDLESTDRDTNNSEDLVVDDDDDEEDISDVEISDTDHDDGEDGEENLNSSLHSMSNYDQHQKTAKPTKTIINEPDKKKIDMKKKNKAKEKEELRKKLLASKDGPAVVEPKSPPTSPTRRNRRKAIDRKAGTELTPFVIQRDGKIKFRNYNEDQKKREQSRQRKESIKSSLFSMLDEEDDDADLAAFLAKPSKKKPNKLYSVQSRTFFTKGGPKKKS
mmetsp:Transcript_26182/g.62206  ORF Transcript_26182/g.62206 Transcript_26182/m.62206 type:complete len:438 (+) Transcript_26182:228-1541(+)